MTATRPNKTAMARIVAIAAAALLALVPATASAAGLESTGSLLTERYKAAAAPLPGGDVLVAGGLHHIAFGTASESLASAEVYNAGAGSFEATGSMAVSRMDPAAAPLPDGRVLVVGGQIWGGGGTPLASAEIYDPESGEFTATGSMAVTRFGAMAAPLPDGRILVAGGYGEGSLASAEIYDPETGEFSSTGSMASPHGLGMAATLPDGSVLIASRGSGGNALRGEIYDSGTETFGLGPEMSRPYSGQGGTLDDGTILMFAEFNRREMPSLKVTQEYDPVAASFSETGVDLDVERPAVAPLAGGRMLIVGGRSDNSKAFEGQDIVPFAQIYDPSAPQPTAGPASTGSGSGAQPEAAAGGIEGSADEAGWEAASASSGHAAASSPRAAVMPKAGRTCRTKAAGKRHAARHTRATCSKPGAKSGRHRS